MQIMYVDRRCWDSRRQEDARYTNFRIHFWIFEFTSEFSSELLNSVLNYWIQFWINEFTFCFSIVQFLQSEFTFEFLNSLLNFWIHFWIIEFTFELLNSLYNSFLWIYSLFNKWIHLQSIKAHLPEWMVYVGQIDLRVLVQLKNCNVSYINNVYIDKTKHTYVWWSIPYTHG